MGVFSEPFPHFEKTAMGISAIRAKSETGNGTNAVVIWSHHMCCDSKIW